MKHNLSLAQPYRKIKDLTPIALQARRQKKEAKGVRSLILLLNLILFYQEIGHDLCQ